MWHCVFSNFMSPDRLFDSNYYYIPGANSSSSVSVGVASISPASSSSGGTVCDILSILTKQMQNYMLPFDIW